MKYKITLNDKVYEVAVEQGEAIMLDVSAAPIAPIAAAPAPAAAPAAPQAAPAPAASVAVTGGEVIPSPLPGTVVAIKVTVGESVKQGQSLATVEAMKMENDIKSPRDGIVAQIIAAKGTTVTTGAPLLTLQ